MIDLLSTRKIKTLRFGELLSEFKYFVDRCSINYQLYVSEFTFEKIKKEVESEKFELVMKINGVFSQIQNQLLAIPVALLLVGSQLTSIGSVSLSNLSILAGSIVFSFIMSMLIKNQTNSLCAIEMEMNAQWDRFRSSHKLINDKLEPHYVQMTERLVEQHKYLASIKVIVAASIYVSSGYFVYVSSVNVKQMVCFFVWSVLSAMAILGIRLFFTSCCKE